MGLAYKRAGYCSICEAYSEFTSKYDWYRDHLLCSGCGSIPRERALALVLSRRFPNWRSLAIHESSPGARGLSAKLKRECPGYVETQFFRGEPLGKMINGFRNENLEVQTFLEGNFDLVITQDVLEHVNEPEEVLCEVSRTLKSGGAFVFTVPTYKDRVTSERRARYADDGSIEHIAEPEYHGNPISDAGSLVTFHYGHDLAELITKWSDMDVEVLRFHDHHHGIIGDFTEVYLATKREGRQPSKPETVAENDRWPEQIQSVLRKAAAPFGVSAEVHRDDATFRFLHDHPGFASKADAINYYFSDGAQSAAKVGRHVEKWMGISRTLSILEFGAGYGAITRHAKAALSPHLLYCSDPNPEAVDFVRDALQVATVPSAGTPEEVQFPAKYDVIFALAFFSHLPRATWSGWLQRLYAGLSPNGLLLFTTHGTTSMKYFPDARLDATGYWHEGSDQGATGQSKPSGQAVTSKAFVDARIAELPSAQYLDWEPAGWWEHQDVYVVRKA